MTQATKEFKPNKGKQLEIDVDGVTYLRLPIKTNLITQKDNIFDLLRKYAVPHLQERWVFIQESCTILKL